MTAPTPDTPPRTSLTNVDGTMKEGVPSLIAIAFGLLLIVFAMAWALIGAFITKAHSTADDMLIGGCLLVAFMLVLPANFEKAVSVLKPVLPWSGRKDP